MALHLRLSSRDGRLHELGQPYAVICRDTNDLVSTHASHAAALRAMVCLQQVGISSHAWGLSVQALHEIIGDVSERLHGKRDFDTLYGTSQAKLIRAVHTDLRSQRR